MKRISFVEFRQNRQNELKQMEQLFSRTIRKDLSSIAEVESCITNQTAKGSGQLIIFDHQDNSWDFDDSATKMKLIDFNLNHSGELVRLFDIEE